MTQQHSVRVDEYTSPPTELDEPDYWVAGFDGTDVNDDIAAAINEWLRTEKRGWRVKQIHFSTVIGIDGPYHTALVEVER